MEKHKLNTRASIRKAPPSKDTPEIRTPLAISVQIRGVIPWNLPGLSVSDDELSLTSANGNQTVDSLDSALHRLPHRDPGNNTGSLRPHSGTLRRIQWALK